MPNIAVIQDGTETVRQRFADVAVCYERIAAELSQDRFVDFRVEFFSDERVGPLLETIDTDDWSCLVFASNALLSGQIDGAVRRHAARLHEYLRAGGGLVVLHQQRDSIAPLLPPDLLAPQLERPSQRGQATTAPADGAEADILLRFPWPVAWQTLRDISVEEVGRLRASGATIELRTLYYKALQQDSLPPSMKPVLASSVGDLLVCRSQDHVRARVVIATPPLDWQANRPGQAEATRALLRNAVRFAALGRPPRLVWYREETYDNELLLRWLAEDGRGVTRPAPAAARLDEIDAWLLESVDTFVLPNACLDTVEGQPEVERFLDAGGVLVAAGTERRGRTTRATALMGRHEERSLALGLFAELRAVDGWESPDGAFELRNILQAVDYLVRDPVHARSAVAAGPTDGERLAGEIEGRLTDPEHTEDLGSSIALLRCLAHLRDAARPLDGQHIDWLEDEGPRRSFDVCMQIRAAVAFARATPDSRFLVDAYAGLEQTDAARRSPATLARVLEAGALLDQAGLLADEATGAAELAGLATDWLDGREDLPSGGWVSVEATADLTLGLATLHRHLPRDVGARTEQALVAALATGATALRRARRRYEPNAKGVSWLARLTHAVIVSDRRLPIGLQRMSTLEWPDSGETTYAGRRSVQALLEDIGGRNVRLAREGAETTRELDTARAEAARREGELRLAARIGRGAATGLPTIALFGAAAAVMVAIGWDSPTGVLANAAVLLGVVATLLQIVFKFLQSHGLLAEPGVKAREVVEQVAAPVAGQLAKLKRG